MTIRRQDLALGFVGLVAVTAASCARAPETPSSPAAAADAGAPPVIDRVTPLPSPLPDIVARVNGQPVRIQQVLGLAKKALGDSKEREKDMPGAVRQAMHQYIVRELLFQEAMAKGVSADTKKVEAVYDRVRAGFKDERRWQESLADQGLDVQGYKQELRVQETVNALLAKVGESVVVSDQDAKTFYEANPRAVDPGETLKVREILMRVPPGAADRVKEAARVKAGIARNRAQAGEDFDKLRGELSGDRDPKAGEPKEIRRGAWPPASEQAAYALMPGQVSGVLESPEGYAVIKLEGRTPGPTPSFEDVKEAIKTGMLARKRQEAYQALTNSLRAKARIETYL